MKLIATLRNLLETTLLNNTGLNSNASGTRGTSSPQPTQATDSRTIEVMEVAGSRAPSPSPVRRHGRFGRNA